MSVQPADARSGVSADRTCAVELGAGELELGNGSVARIHEGSGDQGTGRNAWSNISEASRRAFLRMMVTAPQTLPQFTVLKRSRDSEIFRCMVEGGSAVVACRRFRESGFRRWCGRRLRTRAERQGAALRRLGSLGLPVPAALATVRGGLDRSWSWLVTDYLSNLTDLDRIAMAELPRTSAGDLRRRKRALIERVASLFEAIDRSGLHHRDLKASNILLQEAADSVTPAEAWVVDIEGFRSGGLFRERLRRQRLTRLAASLREYPSVKATDYARFLREYGERVGWSRERRKSEFRRIARLSSVYLRRSRSRKGDKLDGFAG